MKIRLTVLIYILLLILAGCSVFGGDPTATQAPTLPPMTKAPTKVPALTPMPTGPTPSPTPLPTSQPMPGEEDPNGGDVGSANTTDYSNTTIGFSGKAPAGYLERVDETRVRFVEDLPGDQFSTRIFVYVRDYDAAPGNAEEMRDYAEIAAEDVIEDYSVKMTERTESTLIGATALEYTLRGERAPMTEGGASIDVRGKIRFTITNGKMVTVIYVATRDNVEENMGLFTAMCNSLALL